VDDVWIASRTRRGLRLISKLSDGRPIPFVSAARLSSVKHSGVQTGLFYQAAKQLKYRRIVARFEREEREIEDEAQRLRDALTDEQWQRSILRFGRYHGI
jgi:hypothetical protein